MAYAEDRGRTLWRSVRSSVDPSSLLHSTPTSRSSSSGTPAMTLSAILRPLLQCPACDEIISLPTTLACGHTVCSKHVRLSPTESAAALFASPSSSASSTTNPPPLPSCPILTCLTPVGARPLRHQDLSHDDDRPSSTRAHDPAFPPVVYVPPPNDRRAARYIPPPPHAQVKVPNPKLDVTLQRVLDALAPFMERVVIPASKAAPRFVDSMVPTSSKSPSRRAASRSSNRSIASIQHGVHDLRLRSSSRPASPSPSPASIATLDDKPGSYTTSLPGTLPSNDDEKESHLSDAPPPPAKRQRRGSTSTTDSVIRVAPPSPDLPPPSLHSSRGPGLESSPSAPGSTTPAPTEAVLALVDQLEPEERELVTSALLPDLTCDVCFQLFYDPVTTPCQHTFCSKCLLRTLDHSPLCPLCRDVLPGFAYYHDHPSNEILLGLLKTLFAIPYAARKLNTLADEGLMNPLENVPIFPCTLAFPNQPISLNIFEPRYRLMIRRILANGTATFGMTMHPSPYTGEETMHGTMLRVKRVQMHIDGTSAVDTVGTWRFRIVSRTWLDGYMVANVERIEDYPSEIEANLEATRPTSYPTSPLLDPDHPILDSPPSALLPTPPPSTMKRPSPSPPSIEESTTEELNERCLEFVRRMRRRVAPWVVQRMDAAYGPMPEDSARLSFWMALVLPIDDYDKGKLLSLRSPRLRLQLIAHWIMALDKQTWWQSSGCVIM